MSVYLRKGRGWKYDFVLGGKRHTSTYFQTKSEAKRAEALRKEELRNPQPAQVSETTPTDMAFLELVNKRLDHVKAYNSAQHYRGYVYLAQKWTARWGKLHCSNITRDDIERFVLERSKVSAHTANKEIRALRATFNWARKKGLFPHNPTEGLQFLPVEQKLKYVPSPEDIDKVIEVAEPDTRDYLWAIRDTMGRMSEVNRLTWDDINFEQRYVVLYTRKRRGGNLTPRKIPMTERLHAIMIRRFNERDKENPWVFWHRYWSRKNNRFISGPFIDRKRLMKSLCKKANVRYFRFHALRHSGASVMDTNNVSMGSIQRILGHTNRKTTEIYLHNLGQADRNAMAVFERASKNSHPNSHPNENRESTMQANPL